MRVIIAGSRGADEKDTLRAIQESGFDITEVVCGRAKGADTHGENWAFRRGIPVAEFPAEWHAHGKSAGVRRNQMMVTYADALIAIWDGKSTGTKDCINRAIRKKMPMYVYRYIG